MRLSQQEFRSLQKWIHIFKTGLLSLITCRSVMRPLHPCFVIHGFWYICTYTTRISTQKLQNI